MNEYLDNLRIKYDKSIDLQSIILPCKKMNCGLWFIMYTDMNGNSKYVFIGYV